MNGAAIREAGKGYTATKVEKRDIPSDKLIEEIWGKIKLPHWRWMFGMIATYGLRPHEIAECELDLDGFCHVGDETKTGFHIAWPVHKHWIKDFKLRKEHRPPQSKDDVAHAANDYLHKRGRVPFPLYNLRHAYAIRLFNKNIPSSIGAKVMGHSEEIHRNTYQRWYNAKEIMGLADQYDL
jgi:integrase